MLDTESEGTTRFKKPRALGYSFPRYTWNTTTGPEASMQYAVRCASNYICNQIHLTNCLESHALPTHSTGVRVDVSANVVRFEKTYFDV